jgi:hypothetical protein
MVSKWMERVACPIEGCDYIAGKRSNIVGHLISKQHAVPRQEATRLANTLPGLDDPQPLAVLPVVGPLHARRVMEYVECPFDGCGAVQRRKQMYKHLESVHVVEHRKALRLVRGLPAAERQEAARSNLPYRNSHVGSGGPKKRPAMVPAPVVVEAARVRVVSVDPTEAALAVVESQVNGHGVPVHLLQDVMQYIDATREICAKLREGL